MPSGRTKQAQFRWSVSRGSKLVKEGTAAWGAIAEATLTAAIEHQKALLGGELQWTILVGSVGSISAALADYRYSVWGPRNGSREHNRRF